MPSSALDRLIPTPRLCEVDCIDVAASQTATWEHLRHGEIARAPLTRALFIIRSLTSRHKAEAEADPGVHLDHLMSSPERPGFQILIDQPPHEVAIGAVGKVWQLDIPFVHVDDADRYAAFDAEGFIKVAWAIRLSPRGAGGTHVEIEVRVDATDEASWKKFRRYFRVIGPASRFIRRSALRALGRRFGRAA